MANPQIQNNGVAVAVAEVAGAGAGTTVPVFTGTANFNVWLNGTKVIADTVLTTLPVTVNGLTVSALTNDAVPKYTSATIAVALSSTLAGAVGYIINTNFGNGTASSGVFDLVLGGGGGASTAPTTSPVITSTSGAGGNSVGTGAVAIPAGVGINLYRNTTNTATGGTLVYALTYSATSQAAISFIDNTAPVGTVSYYYAVYTNGSGIGPVSNIASATATATSSSTTSGNPSNVATATPNAPIGQATTLIATAGNAQVLLQWTNPTQLSAVSVLRRVAVPSGSAVNAFTTVAKLIATTPGTPSTVPTFYLDSTVTNGITYDFEVVTAP